MKWHTEDEMILDDGYVLKFNWYYDTDADWDISTNIAMMVVVYLKKKWKKRNILNQKNEKE